MPRRDGEVLASPSLDAIHELLAQNATQLRQISYDVQGQSLQKLRVDARSTACGEAIQYTSRLIGQSLSHVTPERIVVSGHQPILYHPGVWLKDFAVGRLASRAQGVGLSLVVDNDTFSSTSIRVPQGTRENPQTVSIPFDRHRASQPWEDAQILDRQLFASFGDRVAKTLGAWNIEPLALEFWPHAVDAMRRGVRLADCLVSARCLIERRWGLDNLQLPTSRLCSQRPFLWFFCHIVAHLSRFRAVYNGALFEYRRLNRMRSHTHPVPELKAHDGWLEAPFWVWRSDECQRHHLFARPHDDRIQLSNGLDVVAELPLAADSEATDAVELLCELQSRGIHLRTRALTTTMYTRLFLADMFVHGIGGAKYDQLTDRMIEKFFGVEPPALATVTGTLHLPGPDPFPVCPQDETRLRSLIRDVVLNPQRHLPEDADTRAQALIGQKEHLIAQQHAAKTTGLTRRQRRLRSPANQVRYRQLKSTTAQLGQYTAGLRQRFEAERDTVGRQLRANNVLQNRDFAFCLYPPEKLKSFLNSLAAEDAPNQTGSS